MSQPAQKFPLIQHAGEDASNELRRRAAVVAPAAQRTYTPSLAVLAHSEGSYHWTPEGRKLADFSSGVLVANLGHNPARWWKRVLAYLGLNRLPADGDNNPPGFVPAMTLTAYNALTPLEVLASERLVASLRSQPGGARMEQVMWAATGSEAVQKAIWAALDRRADSDIILATRAGFHGKKGLAGAVTGTEKDPERDSRVHFISFPTVECQSVERRRQPLDLTPYRNELAALAREFPGRICCLVTEPYLGGGGSYHPQKEYLQLLASFCRDNDIVFILDEVQANFGRTGSLYAFSHYGVEPDIVVLGKGLGNGVPVDAAVGRADLFANMHYGEGSDTWSASPLGCAAVLATLDEFETTDVMARAGEAQRGARSGPVPTGRIGHCRQRARRRRRVGRRVRGHWQTHGRRRGQCLRRGLLPGRWLRPGHPPAGSVGRQGDSRQPAVGDALRRSPRVFERNVRFIRVGPAAPGRLARRLPA